MPYFLMLAIQGLPIFYLELAIGQRLRKGAIAAWHEVIYTHFNLESIDVSQNQILNYFDLRLISF